MMGAMILLLVVVAHSTQEMPDNPVLIKKPKTVNKTQSLTSHEAEKLNGQIDIQAEDADWFSQNLAIVKQQAEEELADYQTKLAVAERETQKIRDELARLELLAQQLDGPTTASSEEIAQLKQLLAQQQQRAETAERELAELQKNAAQTAKSYAIIPYRGPNGTFRRPIYVECCNDKIIIQPEGIELGPGDFQVPDRADNPFDSVLRVVRQYYIEMNQVVRGSEPYPLLIVRPSGVEMYETARQATGDWVKDFGYEIVNEDWHIQYPQPNDDLRARIAQQLEISRNRLRGYMVAMQMAGSTPGSGNDAPQFRVDHRGAVTPVGRQIQSGDDLQRRLAANRGEMANGRRQTAADLTDTPVILTSDGGQKMNESNTCVQNIASTIVGGTAEPEWSSAAELAAAKNPEKAARDSVLNRQTDQMTQQMQNPPSQRVQNWGLKGATQFTTGISRYVQIRCEADRFVLPVQAGLTREQIIPGSVSTVTVDQLVRAIWGFQNSWGSAGENTHWRPILRVRVVSGGEQRLAELKTYLRNSGLVIEEYGFR